jgi:cell wall-associated NlpC family hydrolase
MYETERDAVVRVAREWIGTPYHHMGQVKGAGVDCLTLLACVFAEAGVIEKPEIPFYPQDWHMHRSDELYQGGLLQHCVEVAAPAPADVVLWQFGRCFSHGGIVTDWPEIIHAYVGRVVATERVDQAPYLTHLGSSLRPVKFFRLKRWAE